MYPTSTPAPMTTATEAATAPVSVEVDETHKILASAAATLENLLERLTGPRAQHAGECRAFVGLVGSVSELRSKAHELYYLAEEISLRI